MTKDGDLWELVSKIVEQRGPRNTSISKVKAHATWEMVEAGEVNIEQQRGNAWADTAADCADTKSQKKEDRR